jgi:GR25 family glycosyltransferase involved in LPS biosynthesis
MILNFFDGAFYINLDSRTDRKEQFEERSRKVGIIAERFPAISPAAFGIPMHPECDEVQELHKYGCTLSHFAAIRLAKERGYQKVLIFEDDCIFIDDFAEKVWPVIEELKTIKDWDMIYFGGSPEPDFHAPGRMCEQLTPNIYYNPGAIWGAHAYGINQQFYDKILNSDARIYPADMNFICYPSADRRYLMAGDLLTYQDDDSYSDLWGAKMPRTEIYERFHKKYIR